jgi:hypothetical protein
MPPAKSPKRQSSKASAKSTTAAITKKYRPARAEKKPKAVWDRNRCLLKTLWIDYDYSIDFIKELLVQRNRDHFSARQISSRMAKWGYFKYSKKDNTAGTDADADADADAEDGASEEDANDTSSQPPQVTVAPKDDGIADDDISGDIRPSSNNTRCLYHKDWMKIKADIAMAFGHRKMAFRIYIQLADKALQIRPFRCTGVDLLLACCFRAASCDEDTRQAQDLLDRFGSDLPQGPELDLQLSLLREYTKKPSTVANYVRSGTEAALRQLVTTKLDGRSWDEQPRPFTVADLGTWRAVIAILWQLGDKNTDGLSHDMMLLKNQPVKSWVKTYRQDDEHRPSSLLSCLDWVTERLSDIVATPAFTRHIKVNNTNQKWLNYLTLFPFFLEVALQDLESLPWWSQSEPQLSISPVALLSTVCQMILDEPPLDQEPKESLHTIGPDGTILATDTSPAVVAASELSSRSKNYIWETFVYKVFDIDEEAHAVDGSMLGLIEQFLETIAPEEDPVDVHQEGIWDMGQTSGTMFQ